MLHAECVFELNPRPSLCAHQIISLSLYVQTGSIPLPPRRAALAVCTFGELPPPLKSSQSLVFFRRFGYVAGAIKYIVEKNTGINVQC